MLHISKMTKELTTRNINIKQHIKSVETALIGMLPYIQYTVDPFINSHPYWGLTMYAAIGLYGAFMLYRQEELNNLISFIKDHPNEFKSEIVESPEFQKGFILCFEKYLRIRSDDKRVILEKIILGFTVSDDKEKYHLERLTDVLDKISIEALEQLIFIKQVILPIIESTIKEEIAQVRYLPEEKTRIENQCRERQSISKAVMKWLYDNFNINSPKVKEQYNIGSESNPQLSALVANKEYEATREKTTCWAEMTSLGILRLVVVDGGMGGGAGGEYRLTDFGSQFIDFLNI